MAKEYSDKIKQLGNQLKNIKEQATQFSKNKSQRKKMDELSDILMRNGQSN